VGVHDFDRRHRALADQARQIVRGKEAQILGRQNSPLCPSRSNAF
jgi:hypothetical protein